MKHSLIAFAALAALSNLAAAQSSVTLYGKVDLGLVLDSGNAAGKSVRISSGVSGGSRLGVKGVEDLGGGYKASFQIETGFCADSAAPVVTTVPVKNSSGATIGTTTTSVPNFCTGSNSFMGRQAHGDLSGAFGSISAGRQYSLGFNNLSTIDPFGEGYSADINNMVDGAGLRLNNSFHYTTPVFGGFTASGEVALGEQTGNWKGSRVTAGSVNFASGPAYAGLVVYNLDNVNGSGTARRDTQLGGTYDFGIVKVHALAEKATGNPTGAAKLDTLDLMGGLTIPLAGGSVLADYIHHDDKGVLNHDASQLGLGYVYPLSKRTSIYSSFARIQNLHGATFTVGNATEAGTGDKAFSLGVVHNF